MSCIQLAFLMTGKWKKESWFKSYQAWKTYLEQKEVQRAIHQFVVPRGSRVKAIPFFLLKNRMYLVLYLCIMGLQLCHYEFDR